jgi:glucose/mannose transport system permease protein
MGGFRDAIGHTRLKRRSLGRSRRWLAAILFAPSLALVGIFVYGFILFTLRVSVSANYTPFQPDLTPTSDLLDNYRVLMATPRFQIDLRNIFILTVGVLIGATTLGLFLALLVHATARAAGFFRSVFLLPYALSFIVTGVVWRWCFTPNTGFNLLLKSSGISDLFQSLTGSPLQPDWITSPETIGNLNAVLSAVFPGPSEFLQVQLGIPVAIIPVIVAATWQLSGFAMAFFLAGLAGIPEELNEAARVDGAGGWQLFRKITLPLLRGTVVVILVLLGHTALKSFDLVYSMVGRGPGFATDVPAIFVFDQMFRALHYNIGAAASIVMLILVGVIVVPYLASTYGRAE